MKKPILSLLILLTATGCNSTSSNSELVVRNDIQDQSYNQIVVSQVRHSGGVALQNFKLKPGDEVELPYSGITKLRVTRAYQDHSNLYEVTCPAQKEKVLIKLIDIHLNRMPGGCVLTHAGEERGGIISWR